jgi:hypothetical protein
MNTSSHFSFLIDNSSASDICEIVVNIALEKLLVVHTNSLVSNCSSFFCNGFAQPMTITFAFCVLFNFYLLLPGTNYK